MACFICIDAQNITEKPGDTLYRATEEIFLSREKILSKKS